MRLLPMFLTICLATPLSVIAAPASDASPLLAAADREARRMASTVRNPSPEAQAAKDRKWISRHPALAGTLVGAGAGTVMSLVMENELFCSGGDEDCFFHGGSRALVGAAMGAGVGALVGWIAGAARGDRPIAKSRIHEIAKSPTLQTAGSVPFP